MILQDYPRSSGNKELFHSDYAEPHLTYQPI